MSYHDFTHTLDDGRSVRVVVEEYDGKIHGILLADRVRKIEIEPIPECDIDEINAIAQRIVESHVQAGENRVYDEWKDRQVTG